MLTTSFLHENHENKRRENSAHVRGAGYLKSVIINQSHAVFTFVSLVMNMHHAITNPFRKINTHGVFLLDMDELKQFCNGTIASPSHSNVIIYSICISLHSEADFSAS